jgi:hypothetical protein
MTVVLYGTCFGDTPGRVLMEVAQGQVVDLEIQNWGSTYIYTAMSPDLTAMRSFQGAGIWVVTSSGDTSNTHPAQFRPERSTFAAQLIASRTGGRLGWPPPGTNTPDSVFLEGQTLGDAAFSIFSVTLRHEGGGYSEKVAPMAGVQNLAQGVHIGLRAYEECTITLTYNCLGPRGLNPPAISGLGAWGFVGDMLCDADFGPA